MLFRQLGIFFQRYDVIRTCRFFFITAQILATFWAFWLPPVPYGIYFHRRSIDDTFQVDITTPRDKRPSLNTNLIKNTFTRDVKNAAILITKHTRSAYTRPKVLAWSALYAAALALFVQAQTYIQLLWKQIQEGTDSPVAYNGAVEAAQTLLGALGSLASPRLPGAALPAAAAAAQAGAVFAAAYVQHVLVSYAGYIVMGLLYHYSITLASAKIACQLSDESCFGLIFGINTLIGTGLQSILTLVLIQSLSLPITDQYFSISGLFLLLASSWMLGWLLHVCRQKNVVTSQ